MTVDPPARIDSPTATIRTVDTVNDSVNPATADVTAAPPSRIDSPVASTRTVTNVNDSGAGSLRKAMADSVTYDTIRFSLPANSVITATAGALVGTTFITITGEDVPGLTILGNGSSRVFNFTFHTPNVMSLTVQGGRSTSGAGINIGGGMIQGVTFRDNVATSGGGGLYVTGGAITIRNSTFISNVASNDNGGGLQASTGINLAVTIENSLFQGNIASTYRGAAVAVDNSYGAVIRSSRFISNVSGSGGAVSLSSSVSSIPSFLINNFFDGNSTGASSGAMAFQGGRRVTALHNTVVNTINGAGIYVDMQSGGIYTLQNNILTNNPTGMFRLGASNFVTQSNNLFFSNGADLGGAAFGGGSGAVTADPLFVNPAGGDYHIQSTSPARNVGAVVDVSTDVDGEGRPQNGGYDIGFDEADGAELPVLTPRAYLPLIAR